MFGGGFDCCCGSGELLVAGSGTLDLPSSYIIHNVMFIAIGILTLVVMLCYHDTVAW